MSVLDDKPNLYNDLFPIYESFLVMHGMRQNDMAGNPQALQMSEILASYQGYEFWEIIDFPQYLRLIVSADRQARQILFEQIHGNRHPRSKS